MTYYEILQVTENASYEVIHMAYKALVKKYHPDLFIGDPKFAEEKMKEINMAYEVLSDRNKRAEYDAFLHSQSHTHVNEYSEQRQSDSHERSKTPRSFSTAKRSGWIIGCLLFVIFLLCLHPYIESDLYDYALLFAAISFCWTSFVFAFVPGLLCIFKTLSIKEIKVICSANSIAIYTIFLVLYICEVTSTMPLGWLVAIMYYLVNKHTLLLTNPKAKKNKLSILIGLLVASVLLTVIGNALLKNEFKPLDNESSSKKESVEWISERDFFYYEDENVYVLVFELSNEREQPIKCRGTVELKIVNSDNIILYETKYNFQKSDFETWTYEDGTEKVLATIYITPRDIDNGFSSKGTIYFTVYGEDFYFEESTLSIFDLPIKLGYSVAIRTITLETMEMATKILNLWESGDATEASMIALMDEYGSSQGGGKLHYAEPGYYVEEVDSWCFDSERKHGDVAIIESDYGYTICYFSSIVEQ